MRVFLFLLLLLPCFSARRWKRTSYHNSSTCSDDTLFFEDYDLLGIFSSCAAVPCQQDGSSFKKVTCASTPWSSLGLEVVTYGNGDCHNKTSELFYRQAWVGSGACLNFRTRSQIVSCDNGVLAVQNWDAIGCLSKPTRGASFPVGACQTSVRRDSSLIALCVTK